MLILLPKMGIDFNLPTMKYMRDFKPFDEAHESLNFCGPNLEAEMCTNQ
jgi:hypothetical protein